MARNTVFIVRHGENPANLTGEFSYRRIDYPLNDTGRRQAQQTAAYFRDQRINAIFSSPLKRAVETAQIIAQPLGLPVTALESFREVNVGTLEGRATQENWALHDRIFEDWLVRDQPESTFPGGENLTRLVARVRDGLRTVVAGRDGQRLVVAAHGGILVASIRALCPGTTLADLEPLRIANCAITELEIVDGETAQTGILRGWARCSHLI